MSLYQTDNRNNIHQGAIFRFSPFIWLKPPLWIIRVLSWTKPRNVDLFKESETQAFTNPLNNNQEDVLARCKRRYVVVISSDYEGEHSRFTNVLIAPIYTIADKSNEEINRLNAQNTPHWFYLPQDQQHTEVRESFIDLRETRLLNKDFLPLEKKLDFCFSRRACNAIIKRFVDYITSNDPRELTF